MAQYSTNSDFSADAPGTVASGAAVDAITGWTVINPVGGLPGNNSTYTIVADAAAEGGQKCAAAETGWDNNAHFLRFDAAGTIPAGTRLEGLIRFELPALAGEETLVGKILYNAGNYYTLRVYSSGAAQLYYYQGIGAFEGVGAVDSTPDSADVPAAAAINTPYYFRYVKTDAGAWSWKLWSGLYADEPAGWNVGDGGAGGITHTSVTTGETGIGMRSVNQSIIYDWHSIATGADAAPAPGGSDATAPVLSGASGTQTGPATADLAVSTDEGNGTLYWYVSTSATPPSEVDLQAGTGAAYATSTSVSATGAQAAAATGLSASTEYWLHTQHVDAAANASTILTSAASFTTAAIATFDMSGVAQVIKDNTETVQASLSGIAVDIYSRTTGDRVGTRKTGLTTDANGNLQNFSEAAASAGTGYRLWIDLGTGKEAVVRNKVAS